MYKVRHVSLTTSQTFVFIFACNNKKFFLAKMISVNNCSRTRDFYVYESKNVIYYSGKSIFHKYVYMIKGQQENDLGTRLVVCNSFRDLSELRELTRKQGDTCDMIYAMPQTELYACKKLAQPRDDPYINPQCACN